MPLPKAYHQSATVVLAALAWPWLTFLTLLIFRTSMGLAKVNRVHVLRCVLYCSDILLWYGFLLLILMPLRIQANIGTGMRIRPRSSGYGIAEIEIIIALLAIGIGAYRLALAYRRYLRFDRPAATVIASQVIVALFVFNAALAYRVWL